MNFLTIFFIGIAFIFTYSLSFTTFETAPNGGPVRKQRTNEEI
jgi:hypothetical protein